MIKGIILHIYFWLSGLRAQSGGGGGSLYASYPLLIIISLIAVKSLSPTENIVVIHMVENTIMVKQ